jgi:hypothetical protein
MEYETLCIIFDVFTDIIQLILYLCAAVVVFFAFRQGKIKAWLEGESIFFTILIFIIATHMLFTATNYIISNILSFPNSIIRGYTLVTGVSCMGGVIALAGLTAGIIFLFKQKSSD